MELVEGNQNSPVRVMIYEDLQCGDCLALRTLLDQKLLPKYGTRVAFVHRDFPLPKHEWAREAALVNRWLTLRDRVLATRYQREIMAEQLSLKGNALDHWLRLFAVRNKLDAEAMVAATRDPQLIGYLEQDRQAAMARGVTKTPTVYVGNQAFVETIVYEEVARALDVELAH